MRKVILFGLAMVFVLSVPICVWGKIGGGDITFRVPGAENVRFSHEAHAAKNRLKCKECHYQIFTTVEGHQKYAMSDMGRGKSCGACHDGKKAFSVKANCALCHR